MSAVINVNTSNSRVSYCVSIRGSICAHECSSTQIALILLVVNDTNTQCIRLYICSSMITTHVASCNVEIQIVLQCKITCHSIHTVGEQSEAKKRSPELCLFSECCNSRWFLQVRLQQVMYMCTEIGLFATIFSFESSSEHK